MYKVVSGSLMILFIIALAFSLLGVISYSPIAMIASLLVLGFSVYLTSLLFGLFFGVRVHSESSFITAVILFFIFTPTVEASGLAALLLVGMIAAASKFIIAYHGRHILNPAAVGAFVASTVGIAHATWWVGTPVLVIPTFLLGFAILQKTRRVPSSGTFLGLATLLVLIVLMAQGETLSDSLILWLSWPILFFSSFMLTEPLTLPRKRWQQILVAVIVAFVFAVPVTIGEFSTSPAFALLLGNVIAFVMTRQRRIALTFTEQKQLTPTTHEFVFTPKRPLQFQAGQYVEITVPHKKDDFRGSRRSFSITSAPGESTLRLGVKFYEPSSSFKKALKTLKNGVIIESTGTSGSFVLPKDVQAPLLYVAGGIGITPFISHLQSLKSKNEQRDIILFYSVSTPDEIAYKDILVQSGIKVYVVTKTDAQLDLPKGWHHINASFLTNEMFADRVEDITTRTTFISGPPAMIDGVKIQLRRLGVRRIKTDYFIGY